MKIIIPLLYFYLFLSLLSVLLCGLSFDSPTDTYMWSFTDSPCWVSLSAANNERCCFELQVVMMMWTKTTTTLRLLFVSWHENYVDRCCYFSSCYYDLARPLDAASSFAASHWPSTLTSSLRPNHCCRHHHHHHPPSSTSLLSFSFFHAHDSFSKHELCCRHCMMLTLLDHIDSKSQLSTRARDQWTQWVSFVCVSKHPTRTTSLTLS